MNAIEIQTRDGTCPAYVFRPQGSWVFRDIRVYDAEAAERHWQTLTALFAAKLGA